MPVVIFRASRSSCFIGILQVHGLQIAYRSPVGHAGIQWGAGGRPLALSGCSVRYVPAAGETSIPDERAVHRQARVRSMPLGHFSQTWIGIYTRGKANSPSRQAYSVSSALQKN